jgi:ABC-2 type transport system permease protein
MSRLGLTLAFVRRAWLEATSELTPVALAILSFVLAMASQLFFARLIEAVPNPHLEAYGGRYAGFLIVGLSMLDLQHAIIAGLSTRVREAQRQGTLETVIATPAPLGWILFGTALPDVLGALGRMVIYGIIGALFFGIDAATVSWLGVGAVLLVSGAAFAALSLVGAAMTIRMRRGNPIALLVSASSLIAGGVFYPRSVLPGPLRTLGEALPITPALEAARGAVVRGEFPDAARLIHLAAFAVVVGAAGIWLMKSALEHARSDGSLTTW